MRLENRAVAEQVTGLRDEFLRRLDEGFAKVDRRFDTLEAIVLDLGHRVKALEAKVEALEVAVRKNSEDIQHLRAQVAELTGLTRGKAEAKDVAALAERVARLEARVGL